MRVGIGYDSHRFVRGRPLRLGGITIPHDQGLAGHSDADVVLHAIGDALLGAAALGDIGQHFPDTDPAYTNADSGALLTEIVGLLADAGLAATNIDVTIIAESPQIAPHIPDMRASIAGIVQVPVAAVSLKGKTNEGMGWIGRGEGLACLAVTAVDTLT